MSDFRRPSRLSVPGRFVCPVPDYAAPPGGVPILGIDFLAGPGLDGSGHFWVRHPMPWLCSCGCGLRAEPRHPGLAPMEAA